MDSTASGERHKRVSPKKDALQINFRARTGARLLLVAILFLICLWIAQDFLVPLGWALLIAVATWPVYQRFNKRFFADARRGIAPLLFTLLIGLVLFLPVGIAAHRATVEGQALAQSVSSYREKGIPEPQWLSRVPVVGEPAALWWRANLSDAAMLAEWIGAPDKKNEAAMTRAVGAQILHRFFLFVVTLLALFALFRHGAWMENRFLDTADRLLGDPGERLASKVVEAIRGTVTGTMVVAGLEGALIGIAYLVAGIPSAILLSLLTTAFAMLPFGAWVVFGTASLLFVLQGGSASTAAAVFAFGAAVMLIGDTFIWPKMVGTAARLPFLIALIGIFGGLQAFGLIGLFLGPVIMAAFLTVWREWLMPKAGKQTG